MLVQGQKVPEPVNNRHAIVNSIANVKSITQEGELDKIAKMALFLDLYLPKVETLFPVRKYFDLDLNNFSEEQEAVIRMIKNLYFAVLQQEKETPTFDLVKYTPCVYPIEQKTEYINGRQIGIASCQGRRETMEDDYYAGEIQFEMRGQLVKAEVYGIFDGHSGRKSVDFVKENIAVYLTEALDGCGSETEKERRRAFRTCFIQLNADLYAKQDLKNPDFSGTTATVAIIFGGMIYVSNVGDSRTLLVNNGRTIQLSEDAKPNNDRFKKRVVADGAKVILAIGDWRIDGRLNVARTIGDHFDSEGKPSRGICPIPKTTFFPLDAITNGRLIITCDGIFEIILTTNYVGKNVVKWIEEKHTNEQIAARIVQMAIKANSNDNLSVMVIPVGKPASVNKITENISPLPVEVKLK